eukprot:CAMPEP_0172582742 /NCGR_PEP_ID=MMETSP1068-20121228/2269_1 /TAXON_ID=35684 /ORGANISM="Pseudopedinella elastica, Strain CCMP716" /LENGTH=73 /DNA_ID=CAMNT_0013376261 /DNA_START=375 /DNA_END=594 /DNA_ORIENTATION=+
MTTRSSVLKCGEPASQEPLDLYVMLSGIVRNHVVEVARVTFQVALGVGGHDSHVRRATLDNIANAALVYGLNA